MKATSWVFGGFWWVFGGFLEGFWWVFDRKKWDDGQIDGEVHNYNI